MKFFKKLNLPNKLTMLRIILVVVLIVFAILEYYGGSTKVLIANIEIAWTRIAMLIIFIVASFTDFLDGKIARSTNQVTTFGKLFDPIADKLLNNCIVIYFAICNDISFIVPIIYIFRDTFVDGLRMIAAKKNITLAASILGKLKTVSQTILLVLVFILSPLYELYAWSKIVIIVVSVLSCAFSLISGIEYFLKNNQVFMEDC